MFLCCITSFKFWPNLADFESFHPFFHFLMWPFLLLRNFFLHRIQVYRWLKLACAVRTHMSPLNNSVRTRICNRVSLEPRFLEMFKYLSKVLLPRVSKRCLHLSINPTKSTIAIGIARKLSISGFLTAVPIDWKRMLTVFFFSSSHLCSSDHNQKNYIICCCSREFFHWKRKFLHWCYFSFIKPFNQFHFVLSICIVPTQVQPWYSRFIVASFSRSTIGFVWNGSQRHVIWCLWYNAFTTTGQNNSAFSIN